VMLQIVASLIDDSGEITYDHNILGQDSKQGSLTEGEGSVRLTSSY